MRLEAMTTGNKKLLGSFSPFATKSGSRSIPQSARSVFTLAATHSLVYVQHRKRRKKQTDQEPHETPIYFPPTKVEHHGRSSSRAETLGHWRLENLIPAATRNKCIATSNKGLTSSNM